MGGPGHVREHWEKNSKKYTSERTLANMVPKSARDEERKEASWTLPGQRSDSAAKKLGALKNKTKNGRNFWLALQFSASNLLAAAGRESKRLRNG